MPGILIVDDNPNVRTLLRAYVESRTNLAVCGEASNGVEAIQVAKMLAPSLILMDFAMPLLNGATAASILKRNFPEIKIVLFTLYADDLPKSLQRSMGIDLVLSKTDDVKDLPRKLAELLHQPPLAILPAVPPTPAATTEG